MIDIRRIFDKYHVSWRDRGKNVSHNNLVISCVFCNKTFNKDPGEHLSINFLTGECFCYRNPSHKGFIVRVFHELKIPQSEYKDLQFKKVEREEEKTDKNFGLWNFFQPAEESQEAIDYLSGRLFSRPKDICKKFNLRVDEGGKWAGRLIIPLTIGWTGRSMRPHVEPRYNAYTTRDGFYLYTQRSTTCMIVEGAVDAMRVASVSTQFDLIAKCRMELSAAILSYLREKRYLTILTVPDMGVPFIQYMDEKNLLSSYCTYSKVASLQLPVERKDFGAMHEPETREFLIKKAHAA